MSDCASSEDRTQLDHHFIPAFQSMQQVVLIIVTLSLPGFLSQGTTSCPNKLSPYLDVRSKDNVTKTLANTRTPVESSTVTQAQMDAVNIKLKPKGDGNAMRGRNKELDAGKLSMSANSEIDKGKPLESGHFPWHAGINVDGNHFCAGALISGRYIVTTAHCIKDATNFTITLGSVDRNNFENNVVVMTTDTKVVHNSFNEDSLLNNVALLVLPVPLATSGNNIRPVSLPKRSDAIKTFAKEKAYLTGWGFNKEGTYANAMLVRSQLNIMEMGECWKNYGEAVSYQHMCTSGDINSCFANDGSPLVYRDTENTWSLIGLVSFRSDAGCASGQPLVFTRITGVLSWLSEKTAISVRN